MKARSEISTCQYFEFIQSKHTQHWLPKLPDQAKNTVETQEASSDKRNPREEKKGNKWAE